MIMKRAINEIFFSKKGHWTNLIYNFNPANWLLLFRNKAQERGVFSIILLQHITIAIKKPSLVNS